MASVGVRRILCARLRAWPHTCLPTDGASDLFWGPVFWTTVSGACRRADAEGLHRRGSLATPSRTGRWPPSAIADRRSQVFFKKPHGDRWGQRSWDEAQARRRLVGTGPADLLGRKKTTRRSVPTANAGGAPCRSGGHAAGARSSGDFFFGCPSGGRRRRSPIRTLPRCFWSRPAP